jgi:hypothetical protein
MYYIQYKARNESINGQSQLSWAYQDQTTP